jgi:hypothetical protein
MRVNHLNDHRSAGAVLIVRVFRHSKCFTLAVTLSFLLFQFQAFAGPGDELPPAAPNANVAVVQPPGGDIEVRPAVGTGEELAADTIEDKFKFGTLEDKLAEYNSLEQEGGDVVQLRTEIITELRTALDADIVHARKDLNIDSATRKETQKLDEKYALLQTAMHNLRDGANNAATLRPPKERSPADRSLGDVIIFFKKVVTASATGPRRVQFVAPASFLGGHFVAGDLYIDRDRKLASLVTWDSISQTALGLPDDLDLVLPNDFTRVSHEILTDIQQIPTGCRQCSLQFTEEMAKIDLHSELISRLVSDHGSEFENVELNESRNVLSVSRVRGNGGNVSIETLRLTNRGDRLDKALKMSLDRDVEDFRQDRISAEELFDRINQRAEVKADVDTRSKTRAISTKDNLRKEIRANLLIDEMRLADLREVLRILESDEATKLIDESRQLFERVAERAREAGEAQAEVIAPLDEILEEAIESRRSSPKRRVQAASQSESRSEAIPGFQVSPIDRLSSRDSVEGLDAQHFPTPPGGRDERVDATSIGGDEEVRSGPYAELSLAPQDVSEEDSRRVGDILEEARRLNRRDW